LFGKSTILKTGRPDGLDFFRFKNTVKPCDVLPSVTDVMSLTLTFNLPVTHMSKRVIINPTSNAPGTPVRTSATSKLTPALASNATSGSSSPDFSTPAASTGGMNLASKFDALPARSTKAWWSLSCQDFHQILIRFLDQEKTAFFAPGGDNECLPVLLFGSVNRPATCTAMMFELK
jgi:hypothetical protein